MKKIGRGTQRIALLQKLRAVSGEIAEVFDQPRFGKERRTDALLERRVVDQRAEVLLVRQRNAASDRACAAL